MRFVQVGTDNEVPYQKQDRWYSARIYEKHDWSHGVSTFQPAIGVACSPPTDWHPFHLGMRMLYSCIAQGEHLVERLGRELDHEVGCEQHCEPEVVAGIALLPEPLRCFQESALLTRESGFTALIVALGPRHCQGDGEYSCCLEDEAICAKTCET